MYGGIQACSKVHVTNHMRTNCGHFQGYQIVVVYMLRGMPFTLLPCQSTPVCRYGHHSLPSLWQRPCHTNRIRSGNRTEAFRLGNSSDASTSSRQQQTILAQSDTQAASTRTETEHGGASFVAIAMAVLGAAGLTAMIFKKLQNKGYGWLVSARHCVVHCQYCFI